MAGPPARPVGRPIKEPKQRRVHKVSTYLSEAELKRLEDELALSGKVLADWLREAIFEHLPAASKKE